MPINKSERLDDINTVLEERKRLTKACQELTEALSEIEKSGISIKSVNDEGHKETERLLIHKLLIEVSSILANIAGFCDKNAMNRVNAVTRLFSVAMIEPLTYIEVNALLPAIAGFQVNFNKRPFELVGFHVGKIGFSGKKR